MRDYIVNCCNRLRSLVNSRRIFIAVNRQRDAHWRYNLVVFLNFVLATEIPCRLSLFKLHRPKCDIEFAIAIAVSHI